MWINPLSAPVSIRRKTAGLLIGLFLFLPILPLNAAVMVDIPYTEEMIELNTNYDSILDTQDSKRCIAYTDQSQNICDVYEDIIVYLYKTDITPIENVINKNTVQVSDTTYKIYGSDAFYQDEITNSWKETDYGVAEKMDFQAVQNDKLKTVEEIISKLNPLKIYRVNAQIYSGAGDGVINADGSGWASVRGATSGTAAYTNVSDLLGYYEGGTDQLFRNFLSFDTSSLDETDCIAAAVVNLYQTSSFSGDPTMCIIDTSQENPSSLTANDFDNAVFTAISDCPAIVQTQYNNFTLTDYDAINLTGNTTIGLFLEEDITNTSQSAHSYARFYMSEQTGTANDPYITVTMEACATSCGDAECNGAETCADCAEDCGACAGTTTPPADLTEMPTLPLVDDLAVITGRTEHYESTTTEPDWIEYHYYRIPFFFWYILYSIFAFILGYLMIEIKRILKKRHDRN